MDYNELVRYTHNIHVLRKKKHIITSSIILTLLIIILILFLGLSTLDINKFFIGFAQSFIRVVISYIISVVLAILLTLFVTSSQKIESIFLPLFDVLQSFPSFAMFPLLLVWLGRGSTVTIFILIISMLWPILFTLITAQKQTKQELVEVSHVFGATGFKYLRYVQIPLMFSAIITGSIVAWGEAWEAIIAAEIIASVPGVGSYLAEAGTAGRENVLIIGILLLMLLLFIMNKYVWLPLLNKSTKYQGE